MTKTTTAKKYKGFAYGIGPTTRSYATQEEAIAAARRMAKRHMQRAKIKGQLPECRAELA